MRFLIAIALFVCAPAASQELGVSSFGIPSEDDGFPEVFFADPFRITSGSGLPGVSFRHLRIDPSNYWQAVDIVAAAEREKTHREYLASIQYKYSAEKFGLAPRQKKEGNRVEFGVRPNTYGLDSYRYMNRRAHPFMLYRPYYFAPLAN